MSKTTVAYLGLMLNCGACGEAVVVNGHLRWRRTTSLVYRRDKPV
jgi:hypothetical protein